MSPHLLLLPPFHLLALQFLPGSLPVLRQFVDVKGELLVRGCGLVQLLTKHTVHVLQTSASGGVKMEKTRKEINVNAILDGLLFKSLFE